MTTIDEQQIMFAADSLAGDLTTFVIDILRNSECAFRYLGETDQRDLIQKASEKVNRAIGDAVRLIASQGQQAVPVTIKKVVNTGSEVQVTAIASRSDPLRGTLFDLAGFGAVIVVADPSRFMGGDLPQETPDEPQML